MAFERLPWLTKDWLRLYGPAILVAAASSCSMTSEEEVNYESHAVDTQVIRSGPAVEMRLVSTCSEIHVDRQADSEDVELQVSGTYRIQGYYGTRENAYAVPLERSDLKFRIVKEPGVLRLESPEYSQMHHSLSIDEVRVTAPLGIKVSFECRGPADLVDSSSPEATALGGALQEAGAQ